MSERMQRVFRLETFSILYAWIIDCKIIFSSLLANKYLTNSESKSILDIHHATVTLEYTVCEE